MSYHISKKVACSFDEAVAKIIEALKKEGFGVLTEIDVKETLKKKINVDFRKYRILGACNPNLAIQALTAEAHAGVMMPCNVIVQEHTDGSVEVSAINAETSMTVIGNKALEPLAKQVSTALGKAVDSL